MVPWARETCNHAVETAVIVPKTYTPENLNVTTDPFDALTEGGINWAGPPLADVLPPTSIFTTYINTSSHKQSKLNILLYFQLRISRPVSRQKLPIIGAL